ncbi:hypothetical protein CDAR_299981 [Caerostris darwini]|uniref:Uncharacterized protein n=1 Tax=Caerostris darwini TaxID=1538125 RepID=A0AAV4W4W9_9ARAC|nr:hypothetical protein CDAR_299981 [Caerostris darwini]
MRYKKSPPERKCHRNEQHPPLLPNNRRSEDRKDDAHDMFFSLKCFHLELSSFLFQMPNDSSLLFNSEKYADSLNLDECLLNKKRALNLSYSDILNLFSTIE